MNIPDNLLPFWSRGLPLIESEYHPFAVWEHQPTGRVLRTFPDADLAAQFVINNGGTVIPNPTF